MAEATEPGLAQASNRELFQQAAKQAFELHNSGCHVEADEIHLGLLRGPQAALAQHLTGRFAD